MTSLSQVFYLILRHGQRLMVYPSAFAPHPRMVATPAHFEIPFEDLELETRDKVKLRCYLIRPPNPPRATIIMFHGNAMNHGDILAGAREFYRLNCSVITLSYRGYGHSDGLPSEKGLQLDAQAALDHVYSDQTLSSCPTILYGQSLGGAVAIDLASRNTSKVSALIVENTFLSLPHLVRDWPVIGVFSFLCMQRWNSHSKIQKIPPSTPILMLSGKVDTVVPQKHMLALRDIARNRGSSTNKHKWSLFSNVSNNVEEESSGKNIKSKDKFISFDGGGHNDTYMHRGYWEAIARFLNKILTIGDAVPITGDTIQVTGDVVQVTDDT